MNRPRPKIRHGMMCIRLAPGGQATLVSVCSECDHDDMSERIQREVAARRHSDGDDAA